MRGYGSGCRLRSSRSLRSGTHKLFSWDGSQVQARPTDSTGENPRARDDTLSATTTLDTPDRCESDLAGRGFAIRRRAAHDPLGASDRHSDIVIPCQLGPVQIVREVGRGGMGAVFLGHHRLLNRPVAVKFLLDAHGVSTDPGFDQFLQGAQAAAKVRHPGLTAIYHADLFGEVPYLVMEYIDGPTLAAVLKIARHLSRDAALAAISATTDAVAALHEANIVHRDIKPHNVLLNAQGQVFVTDFGLTLDRPPLGGTAGFAPAGTIAYMAPEMFEGAVSPRSDVYALGIMSFELLTGSLPFRAGTFGEWRRGHAETPLPVELLQAAGVPPGVIEVLGRATHKNAMFRYKAAAQFLASLRSADPGTMGSRAGAGELARLACQPIQAVADSSGSSGIHGDSSSYYDQLRDRASDKSRRRAADVPETQPRDRPANPLVADEDVHPLEGFLPTSLSDRYEGLGPARIRYSGMTFVLTCLGYMITRRVPSAFVFFLCMVAWNAFFLLRAIDPKWLQRIRFRLAVKRFPELERFPSIADRGRAWAEAGQAAQRRAGFWMPLMVLAGVGIMLGSYLLAPLAYEAWVPWFTAAAYSLFVFGLLAIPALYSRYIGQSLRTHLNTFGVRVCVPCGYDLRGTTEPRCPECGAMPILPVHRPDGAPQSKRPMTPSPDYLAALASKGLIKREQHAAIEQARHGAADSRTSNAPLVAEAQTRVAPPGIRPFWKRVLTAFGVWLTVAIAAEFTGYGVRSAVLALVLPRSAEASGIAAGWFMPWLLFQDEPWWLEALLVCQPVLASLVSFVVALYVYHRLSFRTVPRDGLTRCGNCGYILRGLNALRCSECGNSIGLAAPAPSDALRLVRARRKRLMLRGALISLLVFLTMAVCHPVFDLGLKLARRALVIVLHLPDRIQVAIQGGRGSATAFLPPAWAAVTAFVAAGFLVALPLIVAATLLYHRMVLPWVWLDGTTRCGQCGAALRNLTEPRCTECEHVI